MDFSSSIPESGTKLGPEMCKLENCEVRSQHIDLYHCLRACSFISPFFCHHGLEVKAKAEDDKEKLTNLPGSLWIPGKADL